MITFIHQYNCLCYHIQHCLHRYPSNLKQYVSQLSIRPTNGEMILPYVNLVYSKTALTIINSGFQPCDTARCNICNNYTTIRIFNKQRIIYGLVWFLCTASPQQSDPKLSGPPSEQGAGGGSRTCD
ncbi:hypothetical protein PoB_000770200 [Plakobranchus ocellatus]|uniref:Uncharacterized protein n=1 Tax=Plakobranchus ocellatus TaxID=259542 RepID=A0AAV3YEA3_9GAST|nr:hypothetical protein PoB_000770200 [Plakobranchus ocellatus]